MADQHDDSPSDSAAGHLANLLGTPVAGSTPEPAHEGIDLEFELFHRNNVSIASLALLSALAKGDAQLRQELLSLVRANHFREKSLERFLFVKISEHIRFHDKSALDLAAFIEEYGPTVWGEPLSERSLASAKFKVAQILEFEVTGKLALQAFQLRKQWALGRGSVTDEQ